MAVGGEVSHPAWPTSPPVIASRVLESNQARSAYKAGRSTGCVTLVEHGRAGVTRPGVSLPGVDVEWIEHSDLHHVVVLRYRCATRPLPPLSRSSRRPVPNSAAYARSGGERRRDGCGPTRSRTPSSPASTGRLALCQLLNRCGDVYPWASGSRGLEPLQPRWLAFHP